MISIRLMTWSINQLRGQTQERDAPPQPGAEAGVIKVIDAFLAQEGPAIVVLQEVPSKNGKYPGPESDPVFIGHLKQLGCYILFDSSEKGRPSSTPSSRRLWPAGPSMSRSLTRPMIGAKAGISRLG